MNTPLLKHVALTGAVVVALTAASVNAQPGHMSGKAVYEEKCAGCHGMTGKGDGPVAQFLIRPAGDLTTIARRNGGQFPNELVWDIIDGRNAETQGPHGTREMPIWGQEFREEALRGRRGAGPGPGLASSPEWHTRNRIVALLDYLQTLQVK